MGGLLLNLDLRCRETTSIRGFEDLSLQICPGHVPIASRRQFGERSGHGQAEPVKGVGRCRPMRIREENRNMFLLATVTLCCSALAGAVALFEQAPWPAPAKQRAETVAIDGTTPTPVRVVGAPFEPNLNPRER
ncbi:MULTISPECIES: hypothetical protein [unclassified Bradyrhizobium]|uniref:hypothetical protein n=1 Tax=unclassified Bradyrhizobium TaxID=2631580 RepID=UPI001FFB82AB|nr:MULTISPECIES: hypothetical protein [unclassified Bradyrhizobium]